MADKKQNKRNIKFLDRATAGLMSLIDKNYVEKVNLTNKDNKFQAIISRELDMVNGVSDSSIIDFIISNNNASQGNHSFGFQNKNGNDSHVDASSLFTKDIGDIFNYFQDVYKNKFIGMQDLKFISKFIPSIGEAVKVTLDSIVGSDDLSNIINRTLILPNNLTEDEKKIVTTEIENIENEYKLLKKLKNVVYKKTLVTGSFYVYAIPYNELFAQFEVYKDSDEYRNSKQGKSTNRLPQDNNSNMTRNMRRANEHYEFTEISTTPAIESFVKFVKKEVGGVTSKSKEEVEKISNILTSNMSTFSISRSPILTDAMESVGQIQSYLNTFGSMNLNDSYFKPIDKSTLQKDPNQYNQEAVKDLEEAEKEFNVGGTYIKLIDAKNIIPVKIFNQVVGYYHIHVQAKNRTNKSGVQGMLSFSAGIFSNVNLTEQKKENAMNDLINSISEGIMNQFSPDFVNQNSEFKQLISDVIIANGLIDNDYKIQFIPASQIVEFLINEDEDGNGESILADALFPAKLLLSLIICKILNYMNKSGNKTIAHVHKGPIDINSSNQLQRVTRMLQETNITFNDLLATNMVFSKFTRDSNIQLPTTPDGKKLVEFEIQEGQDIQLNTDFEDKLERMAINGTGVPSVIMEYMNQADYSKSIDTAHIKFAARVSSLDSDLEDCTTDLYRILIQNSKLSDELKQKLRMSFKFKLPRPRVLINLNNQEFLQSVQQLAQLISDLILGTQDQSDPDLPKIRDKIIEEIVKLNSPFFDWGEIEEIFEKIKLEVKGRPTAQDVGDTNDSEGS